MIKMFLFIRLFVLVFFAMFSITPQAHAGNNEAQDLIGGLIGFGLEKIEQEIQKQGTAPSQLSKKVSDSSSYRGALEVSEDDRIVSYFITKDYKDKVKQAQQIASKALSSQTSKSITSVDVRGLKLMSSYENSLRFAKKEKNVCQSNIDNFYSVHRILTHKRDYRVKAPHDRVSQYVFRCSGSNTTSLENVNLYFTPVGRLYNIAGNIRSSENEVEIVETFKKKNAGKKVVFECYRHEGNKCTSGEVYYKNKNVHLKLSYDTSRGGFKSFDNGQYNYTYEIELVSQHLLDSDINAMRQVLESGESKTETKL